MSQTWSGGAPNEPQKVRDYVMLRLRDAIIGGRLRPGSPLRLSEIAKDLGVSTTPVREALSRLQQEGIVAGNAYRTFRVAPLSLTDIRDYHRLHAFIAGELAVNAAPHMNEDDFLELDDLDRRIAQAAREGSLHEMHDLNFQFHRRIATSGSPSILHTFYRTTSRYVSRRMYPDVSGWVESMDHSHEPIIAALRAQDSVAIRAAAEEHFIVGGESLISDLRQRGGWAETRDESSASEDDEPI